MASNMLMNSLEVGQIHTALHMPLKVCANTANEQHAGDDT
jgi:hypothetical protein